MGDFEKWFKGQDFYTNMRFIHGDRLFDKDGDVYRVLPVQIAYQGWNARQSEIDELKAQLECCRKENAVLLGKVGDGKERVSELNQWNSNQYELIKRNEAHTQSLRHLLQKLIHDDYTTMRPSMAYEIQEILRGAND